MRQGTVCIIVTVKPLNNAREPLVTSNLFRLSLCLFGLLCLSGTALAADDSERLRKLLEQRLQDIQISSIKPSQIAGLYEVTFGTRTALVSADGRYMLVGDLIDLESGRNLTASNRAGLIAGAIEAMGESKMIVFGPDRPRRTLTVFTDVDCPYCVRLHQQVPALNQAGVKVRYLLYPRAGKGTETYRRSVAVWCAKDRRASIGTAKAGGKLDMKDCANPVDEHLKLGAAVGVEGTPTLVLEDGRVLPGFVPTAELLKFLGLQDGQPSAKSP